MFLNKFKALKCFKFLVILYEYMLYQSKNVFIIRLKTILCFKACDRLEDLTEMPFCLFVCLIVCLFVCFFFVFVLFFPEQQTCQI